jgi:Thymidylate kinase
MQEQVGINNVKATHEIGGSCIGQNIRQLILHPKDGQSLSNKAKTMLCWVDRVEHQSYVRSLLAQGIAVVQDRTYLSTYAYQGLLYGDMPLVAAMHSQLNIKNPDILFILDVDPETIIERVGNRHASNTTDPLGNDDMDNMDDRQLKDLCYYYRGIEHQMPATSRLKADSYIVHLDGRKSQEELLQEAIMHIELFMRSPDLWHNTILHPDDKEG